MKFEYIPLKGGLTQQKKEPESYAAFLRRINEKYEMLADDAAAPF